MRNKLAVAAILTGMVCGAIVLVTTKYDVPPLATIAQAMDCSHPCATVAEQIDGNVPAIVYDNEHKLHTLIAVPTGWQSDPLSQRVIQTFGSDRTIREQSSVKIVQADQNFAYRWGTSLPEAASGHPVVLAMQENGAQAKSVYKMAFTPATDVKHECQRLKKLLKKFCPICPRPKPTPDPTTPAQPTLPPIVDTPDETPLVPDDNTLAVALAACVGGLVGWVVMFRRKL